MSIQIVTRDQWGARPPTSVKAITIPTSELWLHHSADDNQGAAGVRRIQNFHMDIRGWSDIAYSYLIDRHGTIFEGRGPGRAGAHTAGHNSVSHAICLIGNFNRVPASTSQIDSVVSLIRHGHQEGWWPQTLTGGHRDVGSTTCPGDNLYNLIPTINLHASTPLEEYHMLWGWPNSPFGNPSPSLSDRIKHTQTLLGVEPDGNRTPALAAEVVAALSNLDGYTAPTADELLDGTRYVDGVALAQLVAGAYEDHFHPDLVTVGELEVHVENPDAHHE